MAALDRTRLGTAEKGIDLSMDADFEPTPRRSKATLWYVLGVAAFIGGIWALSYWTRDVQEAPPQLRGSVWTARADGETRIYFVTEEKRAEQGFFDSDALHSYTLPYSIFRLHKLSAHDGAAVATARIARVDGGVAKNYQVQIRRIEERDIIGPQAGLLWLWNDGLEARDLSTLSVVWTAASLKQRNPESAALLPAERKYYKMLGTLNALVFKGTDARYFRVEAAEGKILPLDEKMLASLSREHSKTADSAFASLEPDSDSLWSTSVSGLMWNSFLDDSRGAWFGLLTADERAPEYWKHPRYSFGPSGEVGRSLFRANFTTEASRMTSEVLIHIDRASIQPVGGERFLMGGFLRRPNADTVWLVTGAAANASTPPTPDTRPIAANTPPPPTSQASLTAASGDSVLVLHRLALGQNSPWQITRLGLDGGVVWTRSTGLAELGHLADGQGTIVLTGYADHSEPTDRRPDLMVFIDEQSGGIRTVNLTVGAGESGPGGDP